MTVKFGALIFLYVSGNYRDNCFVRTGTNTARLKVFINNTWDWLNVGLKLDGTVIGRRFLDLSREKDCLTHAVNRIKKAQQHGARKTPRLWARAKGINTNIANLTAQFIAETYDGSGEVERDEKNYSMCVFPSGKKYHCDLSASYNIGARYFIREILKSLSVTSRLGMEAKVPSCAKRTTCTLSTLISLNAELAS